METIGKDILLAIFGYIGECDKLAIVCTCKWLYSFCVSCSEKIWERKVKYREGMRKNIGYKYVKCLKIDEHRYKRGVLKEIHGDWHIDELDMTINREGDFPLGVNSILGLNITKLEINSLYIDHVRIRKLTKNDRLEVLKIVHGGFDFGMNGMFILKTIGRSMKLLSICNKGQRMRDYSNVVFNRNEKGLEVLELLCYIGIEPRFIEKNHKTIRYYHVLDDTKSLLEAEKHERLVEIIDDMVQGNTDNNIVESNMIQDMKDVKVMKILLGNIDAETFKKYRSLEYLEIWMRERIRGFTFVGEICRTLKYLILGSSIDLYVIKEMKNLRVLATCMKEATIMGETIKITLDGDDPTNKRLREVTEMIGLELMVHKDCYWEKNGTNTKCWNIWDKIRQYTEG
jgi:hypothetical protein